MLPILGLPHVIFLTDFQTLSTFQLEVSNISHQAVNIRTAQREQCGNSHPEADFCSPRHCSVLVAHNSVPESIPRPWELVTAAVLDQTKSGNTQLE